MEALTRRSTQSKWGACLADAMIRMGQRTPPGPPIRATALSHARFATSETSTTSCCPPYNAGANDLKRGRQRSEKQMAAEGIVRADRDGSLVNPEREANRLVSTLNLEKLHLPPSRIKSEVLSLLMHLAVNPRKDGGPIATRLVKAVQNAQSRSVEYPDVQMYQLAIEAWIKSEVYGSTDTALELLLELLSDPDRWAEGKALAPDDANRINGSFAIVAHTLLKGGSKLLQQAYDIVSRMRSLYAKNQYGLKPNVTAMNAILSVLRQSCKASSANEARRVLEGMVEVFRNDPRGDNEPNTLSFNIVIHHFAKVGNFVGAEGVLRWMDSLHNDGVISTRSDLVSYNSILGGLSKSNNPAAVDEAERILGLMEDSAEISPDAVSYSCCITAHARNGNAERAELLLRRMVEKYEEGDESVRPDVIAFGTCIDAWAKAGGLDGARRAEELVGLQEDLHESGGSGLKPSVVTYNTLMNAWARSRARDGGDKAINILNRMPNSGLRPNVITYNTVLTTLSRSGDKRNLKRAEEILRRMEASDDVHPNTITYNAYLDCLARSGNRDAAGRALEVLSRMEERSGDGGAVPDRITYNTVMSVLARSGQRGATQQAMRILEIMEESGEERLLPDTHSYTTCISAWSRSSEPGKIQHALEVFKRLETSFKSGNNHSRPNVAAFNALLSACCFPPEEKRYAVDTALTAIIEFREGNYGKPNHVTYSKIIQVFGTSLSPGPERDRLVAEEFGRCCADGQVSDLVLKAVQKAASPSLLVNLLPMREEGKGKEISLNDVPNDWCRNVSNR